MTHRKPSLAARIRADAARSYLGPANLAEEADANPRRDEVTVSELAERLQLRHHSTVELLDRLAKLKLVARARSDSDRRQVNVRLTPRGAQILEKLSSAHEEQLRRIGPELTGLLNQLGAVRE